MYSKTAAPGHVTVDGAGVGLPRGSGDELGEVSKRGCRGKESNGVKKKRKKSMIDKRRGLEGEIDT